MSPRARLTQQEADPIGGVTAAPLVILGALGAVGISVTFTVMHWREVGTPFAAFVGIALIVVAACALIAGVLPSHGRFASERLWLIVTLATGAAVAEYVSTMGRNTVLYDDYGPVSIGMLLLCMAPYATWTALLGSAGLSSAVLSILILGNVVTSETTRPIGSLILIGSVAIIAMAAAGAAYSRSIVASILGWQRQANRAALRADASRRTGGSDDESDASDRVALLGREVLPFLASVVAAERLTVADADRARELAEALQGSMRSGVDASWLEDLADTVHHAVDVVIDDPSGIATNLTADQRTALTAIVSWLGNGSRATQVRVVLAESGTAGRVEVAATLGSAPPRRREIDRFVSLARAVGFRAESMISRDHAIVELNYPVDGVAGD